MRGLFFFVFAFIGLASPSFGADASQPHPHAGILKPYPAQPSLPTLDANDLARLADGKSVQTQIQEDGSSGGRGLVVQDVNATPDVIWSRILALDKYTEWVSNVTECEVYEKAGNHVKARFVLNATVMSVEYFINHTYYADQSYLTWTLDYSKESDLDDSVGFWYVMPLKDKPGWSRLYYSVDVKLKGWVPGFLKNMITKSGLNKATAWVKRESEKIAKP
jgi:hypothetical protein